MSTFEEFFRAGSGCPPYGYQARIARDGLPPVVQAPTGCGKTGIVLAWLWRRLHGPDTDAIPRRLIYALPQRSLVEQVAGQVAGWLENLRLSQDVALHVVMGGEGATQWQWRMEMHRPAIVVGTVDSLVSKALNRGYGIGRAMYPIDFALVTNGAHWIIDEIQLCPESTTTLRQLAAFADRFGTAEPFGLTCMSATVPKSLLDTVDNAAPGRDETVTIEPDERVGELATRLNAARTIRRLSAEPGDYANVARQVTNLHRQGTLTLVVLNTVTAARELHKGLRGEAVPVTLLHSRFRSRERSDLARKISQLPGEAGHIVVATQVVEAGIDLNAALLVTEAAPWPSVVQRAGRCNRTGQVSDAELRWLPPHTPAPYAEADVTAAVAELQALEGRAVTGEDLLAKEAEITRQQVAVLRRADLVGLFDTAPDLSGADLDISPYVRDAEDLDVQLAWATWTTDAGARDGSPPADAKMPAAQWRCRVPLGELSKLAKRAAVWRLDQAGGGWTRVDASGVRRARPGEVLVMAASDGGYAPETGLDPAAKKPVADCPVMGAEGVVAAAPGTAPGDLAVVVAGTEDAFGADSASIAQRSWITLDQHSQDTRDQAQGLLRALRPGIAESASEAVVTAAYLHDLGKAYPTWQDALCRLVPEDRRDEIQVGRPWAKSDCDKPLRFKGNVAFRHELASLLLVDGPLADLVADIAEQNLARYLITAHHGKLRVQVRDPAEAQPGVLLGLTHGETTPIPRLLGRPATSLTVDLDQFSLGGDRSWTRDVLALRDRFGPFVLAYLEAVVRVADWRASVGKEVSR